MNKIIHLKFLSLKKGIIIFFILFSIVNFASATPVEILMQQNKVTLKMTNKPIKNILMELYRQTKINFIFKNEADMAALSSVSINVSNVSVTEALDKLLKGTDFTYKIEDNVVSIIKKEAPAPKQTTQKSERIFVGGKVIDKATKKPVVGATVVVVNKPSGGITDATGMFSFIANSDDALEISYVGKKTIIYNKSLSQNLVFEMEDNIVGMDDVVVTGYASVNRKDMVGTTTTLNADDIRIAGKTNIADMLQGQVAGMIVTNSSARAGSTPKIQIRGQSTLASEIGNQSPIWVVDGVIQDDPIEMNTRLGLINDMKTLLGNQVSWLNPNDIETITVLKDASATAIYGSRASNGVIVVTTKKPKGDRISINYSGGITVNTRPKYENFNYMNSQERILFSEELFDSGLTYSKIPIKQMNTFDGLLRSYIERDITTDQYLKRRSELETMNTDWFDVLTRTAFSQNHSVSINGRVSDKLSVSASLGYSKNNGQEIKNGVDNMTGRISINAQINERIRINFSINGNKGKTTATAMGGNGGGATPLEYAKKTSRSIPAYNEDGSLAYYQVPSFYTYNNTMPLSYNIINELNETSATNTTARLGASFQATVSLAKWLSYEFLGSYTYNESDRELYRSERSFSIANQYRGYDFGAVEPNSKEYKAAQLPHGGTFDTEKATGNSYNIQNKLLFSKSFEQHRINVMVANEIRSSESKTISTGMWGFLKDRGNTFATPPTQIVPITGNFAPGGFGILSDLYGGKNKVYQKEDTFVSLFATLAYSYDDRYVLNASVRNDMSNRFGQDTNNRFDPTYSFGLKWNVKNESFLKDRAKWLTSLNLSATYGIQGNALLSKSSDLILDRGGLSQYYDEFYSVISSIPNPYLTWERTTNWNFSLSTLLFRAVNINLDYYTRKSNASVSQPVGFENGVSSINMNGGIIYNDGVEVSVSFSPILTRDFAVNISLNSSKNWNKGGKTTLTEAQVMTLGLYTQNNGDIIMKEGFPIGSFWSYQFSRLDDENGSPVFNKMDVDPVIAKNDPTTLLTYSGQSTPDFTGGMSIGLRYKNLSLSSSFSMLFGGNRRLPNPYSQLAGGNKIPSSEVNLSKDLAKRWKKPGDEQSTYFPGISNSLVSFPVPGHGGNSLLSMWELSDIMVTNADFFRCTNMSLSYNLRGKFLEDIKISNLSVGASVANLFVIGSKRYNGFDPELGDSVMPKTFSISLSIGF